MKKFFSLLLSVMLLAALLSSCSDTQKQNDGKLNVVSTVFPSYDFSRQIGEDKINLTLLIPPGGESHTYEPTPSDIIKIKNADVFLYTGGENDTWVKNVLDDVGSEHTAVVAMMDCVETVEEEHVEGMQVYEHEHEHGEDEEHEKDEHVWTSPINAIKISRVIAETFAEKDKENAEFYKNNFLEYEKELKQLDSDIRNVVDNAQRHTLIFGDRFPLRYFADEYGLEYFAAFPGCSAESEPSAKTVSFLIDKVRQEKIGVVFYLEFSNGKCAQTIAEESGAKTLLFHSCHNVTQDEMKRGETYISLMRKNLENLKIALN